MKLALLGTSSLFQSRSLFICPSSQISAHGTAMDTKLYHKPYYPITHYHITILPYYHFTILPFCHITPRVQPYVMDLFTLLHTNKQSIPLKGQFWEGKSEVLSGPVDMTNSVRLIDQEFSEYTPILAFHKYL